MVGADKFHIEIDVAFHFFDRQLRGGDRGRSCIVTICAGKIRQYAKLDRGFALGAWTDERNGRQSGRTG